MKIDQIQMDALVLLKLVKQNASGNLIGVQDDSTLIVTNSYQLPSTAEESEIANFEEKMVTSLNELNYEHQHVGWYQFAKVNVEVFKQLVQLQYLQQQADSSMVGLILEKRNNRIEIFGFQLTAEFMKLYDHKTFNRNTMRDIQEFMVKIPVVVVNSYLIEAMSLSVVDIVLPRAIGQDESSAIICDQLENLIEAADLWGHEGWRWNKSKLVTKEKGSEPGRYEMMMISKQIDSYCYQIEEISQT